MAFWSASSEEVREEWNILSALNGNALQGSAECLDDILDMRNRIYTQGLGRQFNLASYEYSCKTLISELKSGIRKVSLRQRLAALCPEMLDVVHELYFSFDGPHEAVLTTRSQRAHICARFWRQLTTRTA